MVVTLVTTHTTSAGGLASPMLRAPWFSSLRWSHTASYIFQEAYPVFRVAFEEVRVDAMNVG